MAAKRPCLIFRWLLLAGMLFSASTSLAGHSPVVQTFYVPLPENQLLEMFRFVNREADPATPSQNTTSSRSPINSNISISAIADGTIIYYDHWEDGYELDINHPEQATTQIWGDGDPSNGFPPGHPDDLIDAGTLIILQNDVGITAGAVDVTTPFQFNGRDKFAATKTIAVSRVSWATGSGTNMAQSTVVNDTDNWGIEYHVPVGANAQNSGQMFQYTAVAVMAGEGGATVRIDRNNDGTDDDVVTLAQGQSYLTPIDGSNIPLQVGARVRSDRPVQVNMLTGDINSSAFKESRDAGLLPINLWSTTYYTPVSTQNGGNTAPTTRVWLYNPHGTAIDVTFSNRGTGGAGSIANTIVNVPAAGVSNVTIPVGTGARFSSSSTFYAYSTTDSATTTDVTGINADANNANSSFDWGFPLNPADTLTSQFLVSYAKGKDPTNTTSTENSAPVWVTVTGVGDTDVTVYVDLKADGLGALTDPLGNNYDRAYTLKELQQAKIYDNTLPANQQDQSGMLVYVLPGVGGTPTDAKLAVAWGIDPQTASVPSPGLDAGTGMIPAPLFALGKGGELVTDVDANGGVSPGDILEYRVEVINTGRAPVPNLIMVDNLPNDTVYVPGTTRYRMSGGDLIPIPDRTGDEFPLSGPGGYTFDDSGQTILIKGVMEVFFKVRIKGMDDLAPGTQALINTVSASAVGYEHAASDIVLILSAIDHFYLGLPNLPVLGNTSVGAVYPPGSTFSLIDPATPGVSNFDPVTGTYTYVNANAGTYSFDYRICMPEPQTDNCVTATETILIQDITPVNLSGTVFNDWNQNRLQGGIEPGTNAGGTLYVTAIDLLTGQTMGSTAVAGNGAYSMPVLPNRVYTLVLTTTQGGQAPSLPPGWVRTGENRSNILDVVHDGRLQANVGAVNLTGHNFGILSPPSISITKTQDGAPNPAIAAGQVLNYTIVVRNTGQDPQTGVNVTDTLPNGTPGTLSGPTESLAPPNGTNGILDVGETWTYTLSYTVSQADMDAGQTLINTARVTTDRVPGPVEDTAETPVTQTAALTIEKTASPTTYSAVGNEITYSFVVTNSGNVTLSAPFAVVDPTVDEGSMNCNAAPESLAPTASFNCTATYTIVAGDLTAGSVTNVAHATGKGPGGSDVRSPDDSATVLIDRADLAIAKTVSDTTPDVGDVVTYTLTLSNAGPGAATGVQVVDELPNGLGSIGNISNGGVHSGGTITWSGLSVSVGTTIELTYTATVLEPGVGVVYRNLAAITESDQDNPDAPGKNQDEEELTPRQADLSITKLQIQAPVPGQEVADAVLVIPSNVAAGSVIHYLLTVQNDGPDPAIDVTVTDLIPAGISNPQYSRNFGDSWFTWEGSFDFTQIPVGVTEHIVIRGTVGADETGSLFNTGIVDSETHDPVPGNNEGDLETPIVPSADLLLRKEQIGGPVNVDEEIQYRITVTNLGPSTATGVVVTDPIATVVLNPVYSTAIDGTYLPWTGSYTSPDPLAKDAQLVLFIKGTVDPAITVDSISNTAEVDSSTDDPEPGNNEETIDTPLEAFVDLSITKIADRETVAPGEPIVYTITVEHNNGSPFDARNVHIDDIVDLDVFTNVEYSLVSGTGPWLAWNTATNRLPLGDLGNDTSRTIWLRATVISSVTDPSVSNTAIVATDTPDTNPDNDSSTEETGVVRSADLSMEKNLLTDPANVVAGGQVQWELVYRNAGPSDATNVIVTDDVDDRIENVEAAFCTADTTYVPWTGSRNVGTVVAGGECRIFLRGTIPDDFEDTSLLNAATVGNEDEIPDPDPDNNQDEKTATVLTASISLSKTGTLNDDDGKAGVTAGDSISYVFEVTNTGTAPLTDVVVTDPSLPELVCETIDSLAPSATTTVTCSAGASYILTQEDIDAGSLTNTASVTADDPNGKDVSATDDDVQTLAQNPKLSVEKELIESPDPIIAGSSLNYRITATNTGNVTLEEVIVTDDKITPNQETCTDVAPEATCVLEGSYTVTPKDAVAGEVVNTAQADSDQTGDPVEDTLNTPVPVPDPPHADDDESLGNPIGSVVTLDVLENDSASEGLELVPATVSIVYSDPGSDGKTKTVPGEGTWTVDTDGDVTFTPEPGFTGDPTLIKYTVEDNGGQVSNQATVTVTYTEPPVAHDDASHGNMPGTAVTLDSPENDVPSAQRTLNRSAVVIHGADEGSDSRKRTVPGEGEWTVDPETGHVRFTPLENFNADPTPIQYRIHDDQGNVSNLAWVTVDYIPLAADDESLGNPLGQAVTLNVPENDTGGDTVDPTTVRIVDADEDSDGRTRTVPGEGIWTVDPDTGAITFTPEEGFPGNPTPIEYTVEDHEGNLSNAALVTVTYVIAVNVRSVCEQDVPWIEYEVFSELEGPLSIQWFNLLPGGQRGGPFGDLLQNQDRSGRLLWPGAVVGPMGVAVGWPGWELIDGEWVRTDPSAQDPKEIDFSINPTVTGRVTYPEPEPGCRAYPPIPVANDDHDLGNPLGSAVSLDVLLNDVPLTEERPFDPATVQIEGTGSAGLPLVVDGEGTWTIDPATGWITFTPLPGYPGNPTPIQYRVEDIQGAPTNLATVLVTYEGGAAMSLVKEVVDTPAEVFLGDQIRYRITGLNTGETVLTNVRITDDLPGLSELVCEPAQPVTLQPGQGISCTATYEVTLLDTLEDSVDNTAVMLGTTPATNGGDWVLREEDSASVPTVYVYEPIPVPTLSRVALFVSMLGLGLIGAASLRRRRPEGMEM